jgi:hypothetical protein
MEAIIRAMRSKPRLKRVGASVRRWVLKLLGRMVDGASETQIERRFGSALVQRAIFFGMARSFDPSAASGFEGRIVYELTRPASGGEPLSWTIDVSAGRATAQRGVASDAKLTVRLQLADFMRVATGALDPVVPVLQGRASVSGDFGLASRLAMMFGAGPAPR